MKIRNLTCILLITLGLFNHAYSQNYRNKQLALISFDVTIEQSLKVVLDEQADLFPETDNKKADRIVARLKERSWYLIKDKLENETEMYILPLNAHGKSFKYDDYGFPDVSINRALRVGTSKYYIKVDLELNSVSYQKDTGYGASTSETDTTEIIEVKEGDIIPEVKVTITSFTNNGIIPMHKASGYSTVKLPWIISEDIFNGLINQKEFVSEEVTTILGLIDLATTDLIKNF